jgi:hypothetical protein
VTRCSADPGDLESAGSLEDPDGNLFCVVDVDEGYEKT